MEDAIDRPVTRLETRSPDFRRLPRLALFEAVVVDSFVPRGRTGGRELQGQGRFSCANNIIDYYIPV